MIEVLMQKAATADLSHLSQQMESTQAEQEEQTGAKKQKQDLGSLLSTIVSEKKKEVEKGDECEAGTEDEKTQQASKKTPVVVTVFSWCALDGHQRSLCLFVEHMDGCLLLGSCAILSISYAPIPILVSVSGPIPSSSTRTRKNTPIPKTDTP